MDDGRHAEVTCPHCGQELPENRPLGLKLARSSKRLYTLVAKAGKHGIDIDVLFNRLYDDDPGGGPTSGVTCLYTRIWMLNRRLRTKGREIVGVGHGRGSEHRYVLRDVQ